MDDENFKEPEPTTSKKDCQKATSVHELCDKKGHDEHSTNSESWSSAGSYSVKNRVDMTEARTDGPKPIAKRESKIKDRRKKVRRERRHRGRIVKRKRSEVRRQVVRRPLKRKPRIDRRRELSVSTIFTSLSPERTRRPKSPTCKYCGHRCCLKRYCHRTKRVRFKRIRKNKKLGRKRKRILPSECIQVGSCSMMLSPLFVNTNSTPESEEMNEDDGYTEINPEIIYESLRRLTMWKEGVETGVILDFIKLNYPVDPDARRLQDELRGKLHVAVIVGIVTQLSEEVWSLASALKKRKLTRSHVSLFWKIYTDTMSPIARKRVNVVEPVTDDTQTNTALAFDDIKDFVI